MPTTLFLRKGGLMCVIWAFVLFINFVRRAREVLFNPALRKHFSVGYHLSRKLHKNCLLFNPAILSRSIEINYEPKQHYAFYSGLMCVLLGKKDDVHKRKKYQKNKKSFRHNGLSALYFVGKLSNNTKKRNAHFVL